VGDQKNRHQLLRIHEQEALPVKHEDPLPMQRLQLRAVRLDDVDLEAAGAGLGHDALKQVLRRGAPDRGLDAVLLLEGPGDDLHVLDRHRGVDGDRALPLRAVDQARALELPEANLGPMAERPRERARGVTRAG
jgi:hypothetical protein